MIPVNLSFQVTNTCGLNCTSPQPTPSRRAGGQGGVRPRHPEGSFSAGGPRAGAPCFLVTAVPPGPPSGHCHASGSPLAHQPLTPPPRHCTPCQSPGIPAEARNSRLNPNPCPLAKEGRPRGTLVLRGSWMPLPLSFRLQWEARPLGAVGTCSAPHVTLAGPRSESLHLTRVVHVALPGGRRQAPLRVLCSHTHSSVPRTHLRDPRSDAKARRSGH